MALGLGCVGQIPHPTPAQAEVAARIWPGVTVEVLERGRTLYVSRCGGCHNLYPPASIAAERWPGLLERMAPNAKLTSEERNGILRYLSAVSGSPP